MPEQTPASEDIAATDGSVVRPDGDACSTRRNWEQRLEVARRNRDQVLAARDRPAPRKIPLSALTGGRSAPAVLPGDHFTRVRSKEAAPGSGGLDITGRRTDRLMCADDAQAAVSVAAQNSKRTTMPLRAAGFGVMCVVLGYGAAAWMQSAPAEIAPVVLPAVHQTALAPVASEPGQSPPQAAAKPEVLPPASPPDTETAFVILSEGKGGLFRAEPAGADRVVKTVSDASSGPGEVIRTSALRPPVIVQDEQVPPLLALLPDRSSTPQAELPATGQTASFLQVPSDPPMADRLTPDTQATDTSAPAVPLRMFVYAPQSIPEDALDGKLSRLDATGSEVARLQRVDMRISTPHIRYFYEADQKAAMRLGETLGLEARDFRHMAGGGAGRVEVWLAGTAE